MAGDCPILASQSTQLRHRINHTRRYIRIFCLQFQVGLNGRVVRIHCRPFCRESCNKKTSNKLTNVYYCQMLVMFSYFCRFSRFPLFAFWKMTQEPPPLHAVAVVIIVHETLEFSPLPTYQGHCRFLKHPFGFAAA